MEAGIPPEAIPGDWLSYIVAATRKWVGTTTDGASDAASLLGLRQTRGSSDKNYMLVDHTEVVETIVNGNDVWFLQGLIMDGAVRDPAQLRISDKSREPCEGCGTLVPCLRTVLGKTLCNRCCTYDENPRIHVEAGGLSQCQNCTVFNCANHPRRGRAPAGF